MTATEQAPREESTFRWLWRFGLVRSVLAIGFIGITLLQSALELLPDPSEQQWNLAELAFVFYFATAAAQGVAAQTAAQVRDVTERREGGSG
jgi:hypothetical protein